MKPRRLDSETMVSRLATDGPGSSVVLVGLAAVTLISWRRGGRRPPATCFRTGGRSTASGYGRHSRMTGTQSVVFPAERRQSRADAASLKRLGDPPERVNPPHRLDCPVGLLHHESLECYALLVGRRGA